VENAGANALTRSAIGINFDSRHRPLKSEIFMQADAQTTATIAVWIPLASGFVGALVGAAATVLTVWLQARATERRERAKMAIDLAVIDYKMSIDRLTEQAKNSSKPTPVPPIAIHVAYHAGLVQAVLDGKLTGKKHAEIVASMREVRASIAQTSGYSDDPSR